MILVLTVCLNDDNALPVEHKADAARLPEISVKFVKIVTHVGCCPVAVVRKRFNDDRDAVRPVTFVYDIFIVIAAGFTGCFFNCPHNIIVWHIVRTRLCDNIFKF